MNRINVDVTLCEHLGNIHQQTGTVVAIDMHLCLIEFSGSLLNGIRLPFRLNQSNTLTVRQIQDIDTIGPMDGNTPATGDKPHNLISRYRGTTLGKTHRNIV